MRGDRAVLVLALGLAVAAAPRGAHAGDPCLDSLDATAGLRYVAATDSIVGPLDRSTICYYDHKYHYTYTWTWACHGDSMDVTFAPHAVIDITRRQFIRLPAGVADSAAVDPRVRHYQHDRIAITQDERPVLLVQWLVAHLPPLHGRTRCGGEVRGAFADGVFAAAIEARYVAVVMLMRANNDALAAGTRGGATPLTDREAFFSVLYDRPALVRANFPYLAEAESLLATPRYVHALRPRCDGSH